MRKAHAKFRTKAARKHAPRHAGVIRAYRFAMRVPESRSPALFDACDILLGLRNRLVDHIEDIRRANRALKQADPQAKVHYPDRAELYKLVSTWAKQDERLASVHSHLRQNVVTRILEGIERWMEALAEGRSGVRPPRRKDKRHYRSFTFPEYRNGCRIENHKVWLSGFGWFKIHDHRKMLGKPKTVTIKHAQGRWWCTVTTQSFEPDLYAPLAADDPRPDQGGDPGLEALLTLGDGRVFDPPRSWKEAQAGLRKAQRVVSRKFEARQTAHAARCEAAKEKGVTPPALRDVPYSNRLRDAIRVLAKRHTKVERKRGNDHKKLASMLEDTVRRLAVEEHGVQFMMRNRRLAKSAADRAIAAFKHCLGSAFGPKRYVPTANRRAGVGGNSQACVCGHPVPKEIAERMHVCPNCGLRAPRDMVSANIVQLIAFGTLDPALVALVPAVGHPVHAVRGEPAAAANKKTGKKPNKKMVKAKEGRQGKALPACGQHAVRRGGNEAAVSESQACELVETPASESPSKRQSPVCAERPRVGNLPRQARPDGIVTLEGASPPPERCRPEPILREAGPPGPASAGRASRDACRRAELV